MTSMYLGEVEHVWSRGCWSKAMPLAPVRSKQAVFALSFWSYCAMKIANKSYSLIQPILVKNKFFVSDVFDSSYSGQTSMVGFISTIFLICYASGQFFVGALADRSNLRYFISCAMIIAGLLSFSFGGVGMLNYRHLWIYSVIWALNGYAQACGWPANLTVMNNWFGKKARGLIFSAWSANSNIGNILGSVLCGLLFYFFADSPVLWQLTMIFCGSVAIIGALPIFCCLVPDPLSLPPDNKKISSKSLTSRTIQVVPLADDTKCYETVPYALKEKYEVESEEKADDEEAQVVNTAVRRLSVDYSGVSDENVTVPGKTKSKPSSEPPRPKDTAEMSVLKSFSSAICTRGVLSYSIIYACVKGVVYIYIYWMPLFLTSSKGMTNAQAAYVSTIFDIGAFIGGLLFGHITDLIGSRTMVIIGMVSSGAVLAAVLFADVEYSIVGICAVLLFIGMSVGAAQILISGSVALDLGDSGGEEVEGETLSETSKKAKRQSATITGIIEGSGSAGAALLQYCVGMLLVCNDSDSGDSVTCTWDKVFLCISVANVLSLLCLVYLKFSKGTMRLVSCLFNKIRN